MENKRNRDRMVQICNTMRKKVILVLSLLLTFSTLVTKATPKNRLHSKMESA